jgi:signal transduction histidine kinase/CheY-like chemotaxis protein/HAMP domain-containing protein
MKSKIQNLKIGTRLTLGFGIVLLFVILLGAMSYLDSDRLWQFTDSLYNHPFQVIKATRDIKNDILSIDRAMKDIALDEELTNTELQRTIQDIDSYENNAYKSFDIVYKDYLGLRTDVDSAYYAFKDWKLLRDEVIRIKTTGDINKAHSKFKTDNSAYREKMYKHIQVMVDFASARADNFYLLAQKEMNDLFMRFWLVLGFVILISIVLVYLIVQGIRRPLLSLTRVTDQYRQGNYDVRSDYQSVNEIGKLASTFNSMASTVQEELTLRSDAALFGASMLRENDLRLFCKSLMSTLMSATECQVAAIYFLNEEKSQFDHYESIGLATGRIRPFSSHTGEGEFGAVLSGKKICRISQIPEDTVFSFPAVTGEFKPKEIITIPILENGEVVAVISLASLHNFTASAIHLINEIWLMLTARINGVLTFQKISDYSVKLDQQNHHLAEQSKELVMQSDELKEYNIELELQKNQLNEANQLKNTFLSNMSHELRTPLNAVIGLSWVLKRKLKDKIGQEESNFLDIIEKNGKLLLSLINDILDLSRIEAGKEEVSYAKFSLQALIQTITDSLETTAAEKNIAIINQVEAELPPVVSDSGKCYHILQNLISNAVKFTEKGSVEISGHQMGDQICIAVKDTGIGISAEHLPVIFDEFRQADQQASRRFGGTGLGLAIAKKYCQLIGGSLSVESQVGAGSTFTLKLPLVPSGNYEMNKESEIIYSNNIASFSITPTANKESGKTLLLVEDSEPAIIQLTDILNEEGYTLHIARNGREALETLKTVIPNAIILDLMMPEVDGFEVLKKIRGLEEISKIPVLILSAKHVTKEELSFLKENHIFQLIRKGDINRTELLSHIQNMVKPQGQDESLKEERKYKTPNKDTKTKLLVIEDNRDNLEVVKALLQDKHEITDAVTGAEGIEKAKTFKPDLILLDISLPGMDGFAVLKELREYEELQNVPVIALTARAMKGDREELLNYGFDDYISKPIDNVLFEATINKWMNGN